MGESWTGLGLTKGTSADSSDERVGDLQLSQLMTGKSFESVGHSRLSCLALSLFNSIVSLPLSISLSGKIRR